MQDGKRIIQISQPSMGQEEWEAVKEPIFSGWITQGPKVRELEEGFAAIHGVKKALAVSNCTTALHLALVALGIKEGDEVIVPAFTWVSTANAVLYCNATPVFVDVDPRTFNIDTDKIAAKVTAKTKAIIPVHLFGLCADVEAIKEKFPQLKIVEDAACAAGSMANGKYAGSLGDVGCFSLHPRKSISTGEGGMLTTNAEDLAETMNILRNHGASISEEQRHHGPKPYLLPEFSLMGFNYRMTDIQGAVGVVQLKKLQEFIDFRDKWAGYYTGELEQLDWISAPYIPQGYVHSWQSYVTMVHEDRAPMKRNDLMEYLQQQGISTRPGTHAVHMLDFYARKYGIKPEDYPGAYQCNENSMSIPLHNKMVDEDFTYVIEKIKGA